MKKLSTSLISVSFKIKKNCGQSMERNFRSINSFNL